MVVNCDQNNQIKLETNLKSNGIGH